jgi:hypothetical protein
MRGGGEERMRNKPFLPPLPLSSSLRLPLVPKPLTLPLSQWERGRVRGFRGKIP